MKTNRVLVSLAGVSLAGSLLAAPFADGDRVVCWGDSITHGGLYVKMLADFYLTRYPDRNVRFYNAGVSGDNAGAARSRFADDVKRWDPTVVTMMFGMNDCGRGQYDPSKTKDPKYRAALPAREAVVYRNYTNNMARLAACVRAETKARLMYLTPTPYDETAEQKGPKPTPACKGVVAALKRFGDYAKAEAAATGAETVDWFSACQTLVTAEQKRNRAFSLCRTDRVHPEAAGHLFMTYEFIKAQGATNPVSHVVVSATDGKVSKSINATVSGFSRSAGGCAFTVLEKALPWPIPSPAAAALNFARVMEDCNRETLAVKGLEKKGRYELSIDGKPVGVWTGGELDWGINLAPNPKTPQYRQAAAVEKANAERCAIERSALRMYAASRWYLGLKKVNPDDFAAVRAHYDGLKNKNGYFERRLPDYLRDYHKKAELEKDQDLRWAKLLEMRRPQPHRYEVKRLADVNADAAPKNPTVRHIQRTMKAMAASTAAHPAHVRILFYGQSIVGQCWSDQMMAELKRRYPTVIFEVENRAIGGYGADRLSRTAESDLYPFYPDLLFFHDYGNMKKYEEMVRRTRESTTAEIILFSSHLSRGQRPREMLAERDVRTRTIEDIATRYNTMYVDLNKKWCEMLLENGWAEYDLLADGIHMKRHAPGLDLYARFIYEDMACLRDGAPEVAVNGAIETIPCTDPRVKRGADGSLELAFDGNRVVAVSDGTGAAGATAAVTIDGKDPATLPEHWYTTRPGKGPMWMPFVDHVSFETLPVAETWTLTFIEGTKLDANPILYSVAGSVTGPDGTGSTKARFRSNSGRAILEPRDINCVWQYKYAKKQAKPGFTVTWKTAPLFAAPYRAAPAGTHTPLLQNCSNGRHVLKVVPQGGSAGIGAFVVHTPRR